MLMTNPPYGSAEQFLTVGLDVAAHVVLLLRLNFLASARRAHLMRSRPPDVYVLPNRPSFSGRGTDSVEYAWFHWGPGTRDRGSIVVLPPTAVEERSSIGTSTSSSASPPTQRDQRPNNRLQRTALPRRS